MVLNVVRIRLLVVVGAETGQTFIAQVRLHWVDAPNEYIQPTVKLLLVKNKWIVNVTLHEVLVMEGRLWQIGELFQEYDTVTTSSL